MSFLCSYATFSECRLKGIPATPWSWSKEWTYNLIKQKAKRIGILRKNNKHTILDVLIRTPQPHPFLNIIYTYTHVPLYTKTESHNIFAIPDSTKPLDQLLSWDSSVIFLDHKKRYHLWKKIENLMLPDSYITISFNYFFNISNDAKFFMNTSFFRRHDTHFRDNFQINDLHLTKYIARALNKQKFHKMINYLEHNINSDIMIIPYFDLFDPSIFPDTKKAELYLRKIAIGAIGIEFNV
jgi:hypothetical protein